MGSRQMRHSSLLSLLSAKNSALSARPGSRGLRVGVHHAGRRAGFDPGSRNHGRRKRGEWPRGASGCRDDSGGTDRPRGFGDAPRRRAFAAGGGKDWGRLDRRSAALGAFESRRFMSSISFRKTNTMESTQRTATLTTAATVSIITPDSKLGRFPPSLSSRSDVSSAASSEDMRRRDAAAQGPQRTLPQLLQAGARCCSPP